MAAKRVDLERLHEQAANRHFQIEGSIKPPVEAYFALLENQMLGAKVELLWAGDTLNFHFVTILPGGKTAHAETVVMDGRVLNPNSKNHHVAAPLPTLSPGVRAVVNALLALDWEYIGCIKVGNTNLYELKYKNCPIEGGIVLAFHWA